MNANVYDQSGCMLSDGALTVKASSKRVRSPTSTNNLSVDSYKGESSAPSGTRMIFSDTSFPDSAAKRACKANHLPSCIFPSDNYGRLSPLLPGVREIDSPVVLFSDHNLNNGHLGSSDKEDMHAEFRDHSDSTSLAGLQSVDLAVRAFSSSTSAAIRSPRSRDGVSLHLDSDSSPPLFSYQSDNSTNLETSVATDAPT